MERSVFFYSHKIVVVIAEGAEDGERIFQGISTVVYNSVPVKDKEPSPSPSFRPGSQQPALPPASLTRNLWTPTSHLLPSGRPAARVFRKSPEGCKSEVNTLLGQPEPPPYIHFPDLP